MYFFVQITIIKVDVGIRLQKVPASDHILSHRPLINCCTHIGKLIKALADV